MPTASAADPAEVETRLALVLPVGREWFALEMERVREVVTAPLVTPLPTAPSALVGVFNLRGEIVPLFDVAALLGLGPVPGGTFAVVVECAHGLAGITATAMPESVELGPPIASSETDGIAHSYAIGTRVVSMLVPETLFLPGRIGDWS